MTRNLIPITIILTTILFLPRTADAGYVLSIRGDGSSISHSNFNTYYQQTSVNDLNVLNNSQTFTGNGIQTVKTSARVSEVSSFDRFIKLSTEATSNLGGLFVPPAKAVAIASWYDRVVLSGSSPAPSTIYLKFDVDGQLSSIKNSEYGFSSSGASFLAYDFSGNEPGIVGEHSGIHVEEHIANLFNSGGGVAHFNYSNSNVGGTVSDAAGWESLSIDSYNSFQGSFLLPVEMNLEGTGYDFYVGFVSLAAAMDGAANSFLGNSISLAAITDSAGNALDGFEFSFDSGRSITAVPEPSTMLLLGASGIGGLLATRRRKHQSEPNTESV